MNTRFARSNYLLGLKRPFVSRVYLKDEARTPQDYARYGIFDPTDPEFAPRGYFESIHADSASIPAGSKFSGGGASLNYPRAPDSLAPPTPEDLLKDSALDDSSNQAALDAYVRLRKKGLSIESSGLMTVSRAIRAEKKSLDEGFQMTGPDQPKIAEQKKSGKWRIDGVQPSLKISDKEIQLAKDKVAKYGNLLCPGAQPGSGSKE